MRHFGILRQTCSFLILGLLTFALTITQTPEVVAQGILSQPTSIIAQLTPPITATDASRTEPQVIMTVTEQDATYNGLSKAELAQKWRDRLQAALVNELDERSLNQLIV